MPGLLAAACLISRPVTLRHDLRQPNLRVISNRGTGALQRPAPGRASSRTTVPVRSAAFLRPGAAWWKVPKPANMAPVNSVQQLVDQLDAHKEGLVVVEFFGTWCSGCRALQPHLMKLAEEDSSVHWALVDYDENKPLGRGLGVKGLPCLLIFDGARGCVEQLEVTASRLGQLTEALDRHRRPAGSRPAGGGEIPPLPAFPTVRPRRQQVAEQQRLPAAPAAAAAPQAQQQVPNALSNVVELPSAFAREPAAADCS